MSTNSATYIYNYPSSAHLDFEKMQERMLYNPGFDAGVSAAGCMDAPSAIPVYFAAHVRLFEMELMGVRFAAFEFRYGNYRLDIGLESQVWMEKAAGARAPRELIEAFLLLEKLALMEEQIITLCHSDRIV